MVFALIIQTLDSEEPEIAFYRFYSSWPITKLTLVNNPSSSSDLDSNSGNRSCLFHSSQEKKNLLMHLTKKVHMHYSLKLKQTLLPFQHQDSKTLLNGYFVERDWKFENLCVVWQGVPGIGFSLICEKECNVLQAQSGLDFIVSELEKYLQLLSYPTSISKTIDSVALIVEQCLPGGQLLYLNSSLVKCIEKQLEISLQS